MVPRQRASLKLPRSVLGVLAKARAIVAAMTGNPAFPAPDPTLEEVQAAIDEAHDAQIVTYSRALGSVAGRDEKVNELVSLLQSLRAYVQKMADANSEGAAAIIESAGLHVHKSTAYAKPRFHVEDGRVSGSVKVTAESVPGQVFYEWQYSVDGGQTWIDLPTTVRSKTIVSGLTPTRVVSFRYRSGTRKGTSDWSQTMAIMVR